MKLELIATATFGLEAVVKREIQKLGYSILKTEDGKITYSGDERAIVKSNLWLRSADRVLLKMDEFDAEESEVMFQRVKGLPWEDLIPIDGKFTVVGNTVKSVLRSVPKCQSTIKKAIVERLADFYQISHFEETGAEYTVRFNILKNKVTLTIDTTGPGLHKRGYRVADVPAPIKETLAAAMVQLSFWKKDRILVDPCCGSGTIPIEAALIERNIAPGLNRNFVSEQWEMIPSALWKEERLNAYNSIDNDVELNINAYDIDSKAIAAAKENAIEAGVDEDINFERKDIVQLEPIGKNGIIIANPPYGERIGEEREIAKIYKALNKFYKNNEDWSLFIITTDKELESKVMEREADRRRKLYNGRLEVCYYQFHGKKSQKDK